MGWRRMAMRENYLVRQLRSKAKSENERNLREQVLKAETERNEMLEQLERAKAFAQRFYELWYELWGTEPISDDGEYFNERWKKDVLNVQGDI
jgi:hypothetical protein